MVAAAFSIPYMVLGSSFLYQVLIMAHLQISHSKDPSLWVTNPPSNRKPDILQRTWSPANPTIDGSNGGLSLWFPFQFQGFVWLLPKKIAVLFETAKNLMVSPERDFPFHSVSFQKPLQNMLALQKLNFGFPLASQTSPIN